MTDPGIPAQARFWAGEYGRRLRTKLVRALPSTTAEAVVHALEARGALLELNIGPRLHQSIEILKVTHELAPSESVRIPPAPLLPEDVFYFPPIRVHELANVALDVDSGVLAAGEWVINDTGTTYRWARDTAFLSGAGFRFREAARRPEPRPVATVGELNQHYHLIAETVPQMLRIRHVEPDVVFLTSTAPSATTQSVLDVLDVRLEVVPERQVLDCSRLLLRPLDPVDRVHPADMQLLFDTFVPSGSPSDAGDSVYISRQGGVRALEGEARLESWLEHRGYRVLRLERMPFAEQVAALARATTVVAPHGAGLVNTVFMPRGSRVIELATGEWWYPPFRRIAHVRGHEYTLVSMSTSRAARWGSADEAIALLTPLLDGTEGPSA